MNFNVRPYRKSLNTLIIHLQRSIAVVKNQHIGTLQYGIVCGHWFR